MATDVYTGVTIPLSIAGTLYNAYGADVTTSLAITLGASGTVDNPGIYGMDANISLPVLSSAGYALLEAIIIGPQDAFFPALKVSAYGFVSEIGVTETPNNVILPELRILGAGMVGELGVAVPALRPLSLEGLGLLSSIGTATLSLPVLELETLGGLDAFGIANLSFPRLFNTGVFTGGSAGVLNISIPSLRVYGYGLLSVEGTANLTLPSERLFVLVDSVGTLTLCMNVENKALTTYSNYIFNSLCHFKGLNLGAKADGIYALGGTKDDEDGIEWNFKTGLLDLDQGQVVKLQQAWFGYKSDGDLLVTLSMPNGEQYEYDLETHDDHERGSRVKFGKGARTRYLALDVSSVDGHYINLDQLKLHFNRPGDKR